MSARYSNSPELRLTSGSSIRYRVVLLLLSGACLTAVVLVALQGYPLLSVLLLVLLIYAICKLWRDGQRRLNLYWRQGRWQLEANGERIPVEVLPESRCFPGGVYLAWCRSGGGAREGVWLFADSLTPDVLRQLRVRLALEGSVGR